MLEDFIRDARGRKSRKEFAKLLSVHPNTLILYEQGERIPDIDFLVRLAEITDTPFSEILWLRLEKTQDQSTIAALRQRMARESDGQALNKEMFETVVVAILEYLSQKRLKLSPAKQAVLFTALYEAVREDQKQSKSNVVDISKYKELIKLAG